MGEQNYGIDTKVAQKVAEELKAVHDLGVDVAPKLKIVKVSEPPARRAGVKVASVAELVDKLKNEAGVL